MRNEQIKAAAQNIERNFHGWRHEKECGCKPVAARRIAVQEIYETWYSDGEETFKE